MPKKNIRKKVLPSLRQHLIITQSSQEDDSESSYLIQEPDSGETFEFNEQQLFICQSLDGHSTQAKILDDFEKRFKFSISPEDFESFLEQLAEFNLIEFPNQIQNREDISHSSLEQELDNDRIDDLDDEFDDDDVEVKETSRWSFFKNKTESLFRRVAIASSPLGLLIKFLPWLLIPLVILCGWLWFKNQALIQADLLQTKSLISFLLSILIFLVTVNLFTKLTKGLIAATYGLPVKDFGLWLRWGFIPRFYVKMSGLKKLSRNQQLRLHSSPLVLRLVLFVLGTFIWQWNAGRGNSLSGWGIFFAEMGLITFLHGALPLRLGSPGAKVICICFGKPANYPRKLAMRSLQNIRGLFTQKPSRSSASTLSQKDLGIVLVGLTLTGVICFIIIKIALRFATGLTNTFPNIFGGGTFYIILLVLILLSLNYLRTIFTKLDKSNVEDPAFNSDIDLLAPPPNYNESTQKSPLKSSLNKSSFRDFSQLRLWVLLILLLFLFFPLPNYPGGIIQLLPVQKITQIFSDTFTSEVFYILLLGVLLLVFKYKKFALIFVLTLFLLLPAPYAPGGTIQLVPPQQQLIQAPVSGKVTQVFFGGGDGALIQSGTVIASIAADEIENQILTLEEQVGAQRANLDKQRANLDKLVSGASKEHIALLEAQIDTAQEELEKAQTQVNIAQNEFEEAQTLVAAANVRATYSADEVSRLEALYQAGAFPLQNVEAARREAEIAKISVAKQEQNTEEKEQRIEEAKQNVDVARKQLQEANANLQLLLSGSAEQDVEAARQDVEAAQAELRRLEQEAKFAQAKENSANLIMPFDGYLVDAYLRTKVGSYLNQGDTFAVAQYTVKLLAELELPEYDAGEINLNVSAEVKLLAYPSQPIPGEVVSIEPATVEIENSYGRIFKVLIELKDSHLTLKPGMSGYGKIGLGKKPIIVLLTKPLIRFVQVELWSWLP